MDGHQSEDNKKRKRDDSNTKLKAYVEDVIEDLKAETEAVTEFMSSRVDDVGRMIQAVEDSLVDRRARLEPPAPDPVPARENNPTPLREVKPKD